MLEGRYKDTETTREAMITMMGIFRVVVFLASWEVGGKQG